MRHPPVVQQVRSELKQARLDPEVRDAIRWPERPPKIGNPPHVRSFASAVRCHRGGRKGFGVPRFMVERTFPDRLSIPVDADGVKAVTGVVQTNSTAGVTWIHSYVTADRHRTYCIYDGPSPEAIRRVAAANGLPVDNVVEVQVLDPYFYR
jgi:Protein of unknown function (DUF4242)